MKAFLTRSSTVLLFEVRLAAPDAAWKSLRSSARARCFFAGFLRIDSAFFFAPLPLFPRSLGRSRRLLSPSLSLEIDSDADSCSEDPGSGECSSSRVRLVSALLLLLPLLLLLAFPAAGSSPAAVPAPISLNGGVAHQLERTAVDAAPS